MSFIYASHRLSRGRVVLRDECFARVVHTDIPMRQTLSVSNSHSVTDQDRIWIRTGLSLNWVSLLDLENRLMESCPMTSSFHFICGPNKWYVGKRCCFHFGSDLDWNIRCIDVLTGVNVATNLGSCAIRNLSSTTKKCFWLNQQIENYRSTKNTSDIVVGHKQILITGCSNKSNQLYLLHFTDRPVGR